MRRKNQLHAFTTLAALQCLLKGRKQVHALKLRRGCNVIILVQVSCREKLQKELLWLTCLQ